MITALFTIASVLGSEIEDVLISVTVLIVAIAYRLAPLLGSLIIGLFVLVNRSYEVSVLIGIEDTDQMVYQGDYPPIYKDPTLKNTTLVVPKTASTATI